MLRILKRIKRHVEWRYGRILLKPPKIMGRRLRIFFRDGSFMDVRYPRRGEYSLHWQKGGIIIRIDTAPHHPHISTFPRHMNYLSEKNVIEDKVTVLMGNPVSNVDRFIDFLIRNKFIT